MARNRKIKYLWNPRKSSKCRTKVTQRGASCAAEPARESPAPTIQNSKFAIPNSPTIPSHLTESDRERRRACEGRLVEIIERRLTCDGHEMELEDLVKIQKMLCELKKQDTAAENHLLARAAAQADQDERAAQRAEQSQPELSREQKADALRQIAGEIYGLDLDAAPPRNPAAPPDRPPAPAMHPPDTKSPDHQIATSPNDSQAESRSRLAHDKTRPVAGFLKT